MLQPNKNSIVTQLLLAEGGSPNPGGPGADGAARITEIRTAIGELLAQGAKSPRVIAQGLNERGIGGPRGGPWSTWQVQAMLNRFRSIRRRRPG
jgi:Recombinase